MQNPTRHFHLQAAALWIAVALMFLISTASHAQFADEVWIQPGTFDKNHTTGTSTGCRFLEERDFRTNMLSEVLDAQNWPVTIDRTYVFGILLNALVKPCDINSDGDTNDPGETWLSDADVGDLATFLSGDRDDNGSIESPEIEMAINVGGVNLKSADYCNSSATPGEDTAVSDFKKIERWLENDGEVNHLLFDFPFGKIYQNTEGETCNPPGTTPAAIWDNERIAQEVKAYLDEMQSQVNSSSLTAPQKAAYDPKIHLWEAGVGYELEANDPDAQSWGVGVDFADLLQKMKDEVGSDFVGFLTDADPNYVENQGTATNWNFDRVISAEEIAREKNLRVGVSNHLGPCAFGAFGSPLQWEKANCSMNGVDINWSPSQFSTWAKDTFVRYAEDYVDAGGNPDFLMLFVWHRYPTDFGAEDDIPAESLAAISKTVLTDVYPEVSFFDYFEDDFDDELSWDDQSSCFTINSQDELEDASTTGDGHLGNGLCLETLKTESTGVEDQLADVEMTVDLTIDNVSTDPLASPWAGVVFRQSDPTDAPWHSGYLIRVKDDGTASIYQKDSGTLDSASLTGSPSTGVTLRIDLRGNRIRVYEGSATSPLLDATDDAHRTGTISLVTLDAAATYDNVEIDRIERLAFEDDFESYGTSLTTPWVSIADFGIDDTVSSDQQLESTGSNSNATVQDDTFANVHVSGEITIDGAGSGWGALHIRKTATGDRIWTSGYAAMVKTGTSGPPAVEDTVELYCKVCDSANPTLKSANLGQSTGSGSVSYTVDMVAVGDRIQIYVDGVKKIDEVVTTTTKPASGYVGLAAKSGTDDVYFDDVAVREID